MEKNSEKILEVKDVLDPYGLSELGVSMYVKTGEAVALLGRNGAGKTTLLRIITGLTRPRAGKIFYKNIEITNKKPFEIAKLGIGYAPDDRRIFPDLTVEENLQLAGRLARVTGGGWNLEKIYNLFPILKDLKRSKGMHLSGGEQKMLAIGRALMTNPELLLLDEPAEGLAPMVVRDLIYKIQEIKETGVAILVADQNMRFCRRIAERGYIIERATIRYEGQMDEIWRNEEIKTKYLAV